MKFISVSRLGSVRPVHAPRASKADPGRTGGTVSFRLAAPNRLLDGSFTFLVALIETLVTATPTSYPYRNLS